MGWPLKRSPMPRQRKPMKRESDRHKKQRPSRQAVVQMALDRDRSCRFNKYWLDNYMASREIPIGRKPPSVCDGRLDPHEIIPRDLWADGYLVLSNVVMICRRHHDWITDNGKWAELIGLHKPSWSERPND